ncbi:hypothetical protein ACFX1X_032129 [Malus domestica]
MEAATLQRKKLRSFRRSTATTKLDFIDGLPDDLVVFVLCKLSPSPSSPSDLINVLITGGRASQMVDLVPLPAPATFSPSSPSKPQKNQKTLPQKDGQGRQGKPDGRYGRPRAEVAQ